MEEGPAGDVLSRVESLAKARERKEGGPAADRGWGDHGVSPAMYAKLKGEPLRPRRELLFTDLQQRVCPHPHAVYRGRGFETLEATHREEDYDSPLARVWGVLEEAGVPRPQVDLTASRTSNRSGGFKKVFSPARCAFKSHWGEVCREAAAPLYWCRIWLARQALAKAVRERTWMVMLLPKGKAQELAVMAPAWAAGDHGLFDAASAAEFKQSFQGRIAALSEVQGTEFRPAQGAHWLLTLDFRTWEPPTWAPVRRIVGCGPWGQSVHRLTAPAYNKIARGRTASWRQWAGVCPPDAERCRKCVEGHDHGKAFAVQRAAQAGTKPCENDPVGMLLLTWRVADPLLVEDLLQCTQWGAHSLYFGSRAWKRVSPENHKSFEDRRDQVGASLLREANLGWYWFSPSLGKVPLENFVAPPKAAVDKKPKVGKDGERIQRPPRIIVNASKVVMDGNGTRQVLNDKAFKLAMPLDSTPALVARVVGELKRIREARGKGAESWENYQGDFVDGFSSRPLHPADYHLSGSTIPCEVFEDMQTGLSAETRARWREADAILGEQPPTKQPSYVCGVLTRLNNGGDKNPAIFGKYGRVIKEAASRYMGAQTLDDILYRRWLTLHVDDYDCFGKNDTFEARVAALREFFEKAGIRKSKEFIGKVFELIGYLWDIRDMGQGDAYIGVSSEKRIKAAEAVTAVTDCKKGSTARLDCQGAGRVFHCLVAAPVARTLLRPLHRLIKQKLAVLGGRNLAVAEKYDVKVPWGKRRRLKPLQLWASLYALKALMLTEGKMMVNIYSAYGQPRQHVWVWVDTSRGNSHESDFGLPQTGFTFTTTQKAMCNMGPGERLVKCQKGIVAHSAALTALAVRGEAISTSHVEGVGVGEALAHVPAAEVQGAHVHIMNDSKVFMDGAEKNGTPLGGANYAVYAWLAVIAARLGAAKLTCHHVARDEVALEDGISKQASMRTAEVKIYESAGASEFLWSFWRQAAHTTHLRPSLLREQPNVEMLLDNALPTCTTTDEVVSFCVSLREKGACGDANPVPAAEAEEAPVQPGSK